MVRDQEQINYYLEKIVADELFVRASRYSMLLRFLVEQTIAGCDIKEFTVGQHIFGENYDTMLNDGKARVYIYNLRKKLKEYYRTNGATDKIHLTLQTGSYSIIFEEQSDAGEQNSATTASERHETESPEDVNKPKRATRWLMMLSAVVIIAVLGFTLKERSTPDIFCWSRFMAKDSRNLVILADQIMLQHTIGGYGGATTHPLANNINDYEQMKMGISGDSLNRSQFTFLTKGVSFAMYNLSRWFCANDSGFDMILESECRYAYTLGHNILYIGQYKMMGTTTKIFLKDSKVFSATYNTFIVNKGSEKQVYKSLYNNRSLVSEYALVSYSPLSDGNEALFFVSNHDIGTMSTVSNFTNRDFLESLYSAHDLDGRHFNALFKVNGVDRIDTSCELVELEILED